MIAKVICSSKTRSSCISELSSFLRSTAITGISTNIPLLLKILNHEDFKSGKMNTDFFKDHMPAELKPSITEDELNFIRKELQSPENKSVFDMKWRTSL
jgi:acetyl/propionyl-CoA carboxylase alpha subunit